MPSEELALEPPGHWTVDRRIPLAVLLMLAVQTGGAIWWASSLASRVSSLESFATDVQQRRTQRDLVQLDLAGRIIRLETDNNNTIRQLGTIDNKLDRIIEQRKVP